MAQDNQGGYTLRQISPDDNVSGLSLGNAAFTPLKTYLKRFAKAHHKANAAKTYVITSDAAPQRVVAYVTLLCSNIHIQAPEDMGEYPYHDCPAVKIARLAVDVAHRDNDLGTRLVDWAVAVSTLQIMPHIGCRFLVLDSKQESIAFYKKRGFTLLDTEHNRAKQNPVMFLDLAKLA